MRFLVKVCLIFWIMLVASWLPILLLHQLPIPPHHWVTHSKEGAGNRDVYLRLEGIGIERRITWHPAPDYMPIWSPDGQWIVYETNREVGDGLVNPALYLMRPDGSENRRLLNLPFAPSTHVIEWSPDSATLKVEYQSFRRSLMVLVSIPQGRLIGEFDTEPITTEPTWSSDGRWLLARLYDGFGSNESQQSLLFRIDVKSGWRLRLTDLTGVHNFQWSPTDEWVIFVAPQNGNQEIFRVRNDGRDLQNLTGNPMNDTRPAWSPDGEWIAFTRNEFGADQVNVFRMRADGTDFEVLTDRIGLNLYPQWTADGASILFTSVESRQGVHGWTMFAVSPDSGSVNMIAKQVESRPTQQWSPDGEWFATIGGLVIRNDVYIGNPKLGIYKRLTYDLFRHENPVWSPNGEWVIYRARDEIRQVKIDGDDRVASEVLSDYHPARDARTYAHLWSPILDEYGMYSGWSPDMPACGGWCKGVFWSVTAAPIVIMIATKLRNLIPCRDGHRLADKFAAARTHLSSHHIYPHHGQRPTQK